MLCAFRSAALAIFPLGARPSLSTCKFRCPRLPADAFIHLSHSIVVIYLTCRCMCLDEKPLEGQTQALVTSTSHPHPEQTGTSGQTQQCLWEPAGPFRPSSADPVWEGMGRLSHVYHPLPAQHLGHALAPPIRQPGPTRAQRTRWGGRGQQRGHRPPVPRQAS
ncbi:photoreceptor disk component PRCD isoform X1 [Felis catus]|uniref:photoreceptor disk component PRCD isoform X1 n=1 Tax=Felis catus TaxID=9685 RepID=UPI001D1A2669|nr:photoreceptor disk component PRCD isoform X1 [Felis catus]